MNFGEALEQLKQGKKVSRSVWGGYWMLMNDINLDHFDNDKFESHTIPQLIVAVLRDNKGVAAAMPYQEDILANDWLIVE